jgi:hypothetical protein
MEYLLGAGSLEEDAEAQQLHAAGLQASWRGDFSTARLAFREALSVVEERPITIDSNVQKTRIERDTGRSVVIETLVSGQTHLLADANDLLRSARSTINYLSETTDGSSGQGIQMGKEIFATQARTVGLLGRLATVSAVMFDRETYGDSDFAKRERRDTQKPYGEAHRFFLKSNDGSGRVEHALLGARQERLNKQYLRMLPWLKRAAAGMLWTALHDSQDLGNAWRAVRFRLPALYSYEAAREAVLTSP